MSAALVLVTPGRLFLFSGVAGGKSAALYLYMIRVWKPSASPMTP